MQQLDLVFLAKFRLITMLRNSEVLVASAIQETETERLLLTKPIHDRNMAPMTLQVWPERFHGEAGSTCSVGINEFLASCLSLPSRQSLAAGHRSPHLPGKHLHRKYQRASIA